MKKFKSRIALVAYILINGFITAQNYPPPPPPSMSRPGGVGGETGTPGAPEPSVPIDMYIFALLIVAIALIIYYARKTNQSKPTIEEIKETDTQEMKDDIFARSGSILENHRSGN